jgi:hypothetical protein
LIHNLSPFRRQSSPLDKEHQPLEVRADDSFLVLSVNCLAFLFLPFLILGHQSNKTPRSVSEIIGSDVLGGVIFASVVGEKDRLAWGARKIASGGPS